MLNIFILLTQKTANSKMSKLMRRRALESCGGVYKYTKSKRKSNY